MEKEEFKLLFYLKRSTQDKNERGPIMGHISAGRSMVQFNCKYSCIPHLWGNRKGRLLGKSAGVVSVNKELDHLQVNTHRVYESFSSKSNTSTTAGRVRGLVSRLNSESRGLLHYTDEYIDHFRERVSIGHSKRRLECLLLSHKHPTNFVRYRYRVENIPVQRADITFIKNSEDCFTKERGSKLNTLASYLFMLAPLLKGLHKQHIVDTCPSINHSIHWEVDTPRYITREEVGLIAALGEGKLQGYEKVSRDMFLFSCLTGLPYTDMYRLTE